MTPTQKHAQQYLRAKIETASQNQLVLMLLEGVGRFCEKGKIAIREERLEDSHEALMRAQAIIMELVLGLDKENGGDVAENLGKLYGYAFNCLVVANMNRTEQQINEVQYIFSNLREGWIGAMNKATEDASSPVATPPSKLATKEARPPVKLPPAAVPADSRPRLSIQG